MVTQMVLVGLTIFNLLILVLTFMTYIMALNTKFQINQIHSAMTTLVTKVVNTEMVLSKVVSSFTEFTETASEVFDQIAMNFGGPSHGQLYRTMDGKYSAETLEDLVEKIKKDGKSEEYLTEDMDNLRKLFESEDDIFDEDED